MYSKAAKAHWVRDNTDNFAPRTHNLTFIQDQTKLSLTEDMQADLKVINFWNIEGRYPDYQNLVYRAATRQYMEEQRSMIENMNMLTRENAIETINLFIG